MPSEICAVCNSWVYTIVVRAGLMQILAETPDLEVTGEAATSRDALLNDAAAYLE